MAYLIGIDEAGYGPNLGPLVISASMWQVPDSLLHHDLYALLQPAVSNLPGARQALVWGDSKAVYNSARGLGALELGVLGGLMMTGQTAHTWQELWQALCNHSPDAPEIAAPWHRGFTLDLPAQCDRPQLSALAHTAQSLATKSKIQLLKLRSIAIFPQQFNTQITVLGNKAELLSRATLQLVQSLLEVVRPAETLILCDKHGGRSYYGGLLQHQFPEELIRVCREGPAESCYQWTSGQHQREIRFCTNSERHLPVALASMTSKYLRELSMLAFNQFWQQHLPGLKATAGYPVDARRFRLQTQAKQLELGISDHQFWRNK